MGEYRKSSVYLSEIEDILKREDVENLKNKAIVITGARGLISSELIDTIMYGNKVYNMNCKIYAVVRNIEAAKARFQEYWDSDLLCIVQADINQGEFLLTTLLLLYSCSKQYTSTLLCYQSNRNNFDQYCRNK